MIVVVSSSSGDIGYFAFICVCALHTCSPQGSWKRAGEPLRLEVPTAVSCQVGAGNRAGYHVEPFLHTLFKN